MAYTYVSFAAYLVFMLLIGLHFYKKTSNLSDYILGGRGLGSWVTSLSAQASDMSGWLLLGLPGYAYASGFEASWIAIGLAVGTYLNWKFVAKRLRIYTEVAGDSITLPDYFENRFLDKSKILRIMSAVFILIFFLIYTASGFVSGAKLFNTVFGYSYDIALVIGVVVIISYTFLGGFLAVSWTDFFQGIIMFVAVTIVPVIGFIILKGDFIGPVKEINPELLNMFTDSSGAPIAVVSVISLLAWGLGYFGQPHILSRFMAINDPNAIGKSRIIAMVWVVISLAASILVAIIGIAYFKTPDGVNVMANLATEFEAERVFMVLINALVHPVVAGLFLAAIMAAIMSTADSQLLVTSSALTEDLYRVLIRKKASQKELVAFSRASVIGVAIIAYFIARNPNSSVLDLVSYAWAGFGATFGPIVVISLFWKRMNRLSAILSIFVGAITVIVWKQLSGGIFDIYEIVPGFLLSSLTIFIVSLVGPEPEKEIIDTFNKVTK